MGDGARGGKHSVLGLDPWTDIRRGIPFRLVQEETLLGTLAVHEVRGGWLICACEPTAALAPLRPLFDTTSGIFADPLRAPVSDDAWAALRARLAAHNVHIATSHGATGCFTLHIDGQKAWLRFDGASRQ